MGNTNDLKTQGENIREEVRSSVEAMRERANGMKEDLREGMQEARHDFGKVEADLETAGRTLQDRARDGLDCVKADLESARENILDAGRKVNWKKIAGVAVGLVVVTAVVLMARRRARRGNLLQRAQKATLDLAHDSARESVRLWDKRPRIHVKLR